MVPASGSARQLDPRRDLAEPPAVGFNHAGLMETFVVARDSGQLYYLQATALGQLTLGPQAFPQP